MNKNMKKVYVSPSLTEIKIKGRRCLFEGSPEQGNIKCPTDTTGEGGDGD